jgi:hypothetical protein
MATLAGNAAAAGLMRPRSGGRALLVVKWKWYRWCNLGGFANTFRKKFAFFWKHE